MDLNMLRLFCSIADEGAITRAAAALGQSKGTISRQLRMLEDELGTTLINRSTRKLQLTESGQKLFQRCFPLVQELESIQDELIQQQQVAAGTVSIRLPLEFFAPQFSKLLIAFLERFPLMAVQCNHYIEAFPPFVSSDDLCFAWYEERLPDSDWIASELMSIPQALYAAPDTAKIDAISELATQACITQTDESHWTFRNGTVKTTIRVDGRIKSISPNMRLQAALQGQGICRIPRYLGDPHVDRGTLARIDLDFETTALGVAILYRSKSLPYKIRAFIDFFQSRIADEM